VSVVKININRLNFPIWESFPRVAWDDELVEFDYQARSLQGEWGFRRQAPAVFRFYPTMREGSDFRVDISAWESWWKRLNTDTDGRKFEYWTSPTLAQFNDPDGEGWPKYAYLVMSSNRLEGERMGEWFRFKTLKPTDVTLASDMTYTTHPQFVHKFTLTSYRVVDGETISVRLETTPHGTLYYPVISREGYGLIPWRNIKVPTS
jgi:hypothetical protein